MMQGGDPLGNGQGGPGLLATGASGHWLWTHRPAARA